LSTLPETMRVSRTPDQPWCDLGPEVVVLRVRDNSYYRFEGSGRSIWLLLEEPRSVGDLAALLTTEYLGDPAAIAAEVKRFLAHCAELGLVSLMPLPD
jgi:Coenzyme PQQ synthesis protein D (PqqD)